MKNRNYYLVRSCTEISLEENFVGMGWSIPFAQYKSAEEIIRQIVDVKKWGIGRRANQIRRFKAIAKNDIIIFPLGNNVVLGCATGKERFKEELIDQNGCNQTGVNFFRNSSGEVIFLPRSNFSEGFQRRLKIRIAVADLAEFKDELDKCIDAINTGENYSWLTDHNQTINENIKKFKYELLDNIRNGKTNLQSGGYGLEKLIEELLVADNYTASILSKRAFPNFSDADIKATKTDAFVSSDLLVQVKHHSGTTSSWGIQQLKELPPEYDDYKLALITTAEISKECEEAANEAGIITMDGMGLVDWIYDLIDKLSDDTKNRLGICSVPQLSNNILS